MSERPVHPEQPHFGWTALGHPLHRRTAEYHRADSAYARFNKQVALWVTKNIGTMTCFWVFSFLAGLSLPATLVLVGWVPKTVSWVPAFLLSYGWIYLVQWVCQSYIQLVLLPALMVGQELQNEAADARAARQFEDTETIVDRLDLRTQGGIAELDKKLDMLLELARHLVIGSGAKEETE